jgi:hypothetical protein
LHFRDIPAGSVVEMDGLRVTSVVRTLADCAAEADRESIVSVVDSAINRGRLGAEDLPALTQQLRASRCSFAVGWLRLVDRRAESPSETRVRLVLADAGLPPEELQLLVLDGSGHPIARLDMAHRRGALPRP